jgi:hypothetical protein
MSDILKVSLAFISKKDPDFDIFAAQHVECMTGNLAFPSPSVKPAAVEALRVTFHAALLASAHGGTDLTAAKNEARTPLENALRANAAYVQSIPGLTLSMLLSSGYVQTNQNHAQSQLDTPTLTIDNGISGQLIAHMPPVSNARSYQIQVLTPDGKVLKTVDSTQARNVVIPGLTPGIIYTLIARAVGGLTGYSDWSDPVSHMCM